MMTGRTEIRVRYAETDMMGIAYHGSYLPWLEIGRTELLRDYGLPYAELERVGYRLPVLEVGLRYLKPALYDDMITIESSIAEKPILRIRIDYRLKRGETAIATGHSVHAFLNHQNQPVRPPAIFVDGIARAFGT
ncbi:MAG TPA: thioesterase family protein [Opitutaceae bacterium]